VVAMAMNRDQSADFYARSLSRVKEGNERSVKVRGVSHSEKERSQHCHAA